jgi:hypothetical protein
LEVFHSLRLQHGRSRTAALARSEAGPIRQVEPSMHIYHADGRNISRIGPELHHHTHHHAKPKRNPALYRRHPYLVRRRKSPSPIAWQLELTPLTSGPAILQHPSNNLGWPRKANVLLGQHISVSLKLFIVCCFIL